MVERAHAADLRGAISIGLEESLRSLEESLADLSEAQFHAFPMLGEESIALIALRTLQDLDLHAVVAQGRALLPACRRLGAGCAQRGGRLSAGRAVSSRQQVLGWLQDVRRAAEALLVAATPEDLLSQRTAESPWPGSASSAYLTAIYHSMAQVQRIWLLRGLLRATGKSRLEAAREAAAASTESARTVAELHYAALAEGNLFVWRATLIRELRSPRRVPGLAPQSWWEAGRRAVAHGAAYRFLREEPGDGTGGC